MVKNKFYLLLLLFTLMGILSISGCFHDEENVGYTLTVMLETGVNGTPGHGSYSYEEQTVVPYSYSPKTGYNNLKVFYDEEEIPSSGNLTVSCGDHVLNAKAEKKSLDIRGFWMGHQYCTSLDFNLEVTFSGGLNTGVVEGIVEQADDKKGTGTFTLTSDETTITFHLEVVSQGKTFYFTGTVESANKMKGDYYTVPEQWSGTWELQR